jgi:hypothetical protein
MDGDDPVDTIGDRHGKDRKSSYVMRTIFALAIALAAPAATAAQSSWSSAIDDVRENANVRLGPFYADPALQLKQLGIDGNVFNTDRNTKSDFTFTIMPKADVWLPVARRALFQVTGATDLVYYAQYETERSVDPQYALRGEVYLHRLKLFGASSYVNTRQRPNHEIDTRSRHVEDGLTAGAGVTVTPTFSVEFAASRLKTRYDDDAEFDGTQLQQTLNRDTEGINVTARQKLTPLTSVGVRYDRFRDAFVYSPTRDSRSYRVMPGVEFKPRALVNGSAYVGFRKFTPTVPEALAPFSGLVAELGLSYTLLGATTLGVTYDRDLTYSYEEFQPFFVDNSVGVSVRRAIGRKFDAILSADRHTYEYSDAIGGVPSLDGVQRVDVTLTYAGSIRYRVGRDGGIGFGVSYWQRESTTKQFHDYDSLRIGSSMSFGF